MAILLNGWILPIGGVVPEGSVSAACAAGLFQKDVVTFSASGLTFRWSNTPWCKLLTHRKFSLTLVSDRDSDSDSDSDSESDSDLNSENNSGIYSKFVSVLLSKSVERVGVSRMRDFFTLTPAPLLVHSRR